eukprot:11163070-Lingulodinium_polyedra.AAC.1
MTADGLERSHVDGRVQKATMIEGKDGFAFAKFSDSEMEIETETPNICIPPEPVLKRPAAQ